MVTTKVIYDRAAVVSNEETGTNYQAGTTFDEAEWRRSIPGFPYLVCGPSSYPESIKYKEISSATLNVYSPDQTGTSWLSLGAWAILGPFDERVVTYDSPGSAYNGNSFTMRKATSGSVFGWGSDTFDLDEVVFLRQAVANGLNMHPDLVIETPKGANKPYIELTYGGTDVGITAKQSYPIGSATISKSLPTTFSWETTPATDRTLEPVRAASAVLRWRKSGSSTYTEIACDNPLQCTVPANTFEEGTIQWQVVATANSGAVTTSDWMTTEVREPTSSAVASYPTNTVLDGAAEQTFMWEHIISNGTAQHGFDLQVSRNNGSTWTTLRGATTSQTSTTFAPGTFEAGNLWWRVRTYNAVGTAGKWSDAVHCIVIAAPEAPSITTDDNSPRFVLRWQQIGQQAYELKVDGVTIAKTFSAESIYRHDGYLEPGAHKVQVRIQNCYQMWSDWGTATLQIVNTEGDAIQLSVHGENAVELRWTTSGHYDGYVVYRNGEKIAESAATSYTDHFAVGEVMYQVRGVHLANGNYTMSNAVPVTIAPQTLLIADVTAPEWIKLPLSTASLRSAGLSASQTVTYTHYIGTGLPGAEIGEAVSRSYDLDCAFKATDLESIRRFESLLGKVVCIKTPSQRRIVGVLAQMTARENRFHVSYRAPIVEVRWEEMDV